MLRNVIENDWFTVLLLGCIVLIALAKFFYSKQFNDLLGIFNNSNYSKIYIKEQKFINKFDGLLFVNLVVSLSVFVMISIKVFEQVSQFQNNHLLYRLAIGLGSVILIKVLFDRLLGSLFDIDDMMNVYVFQKISLKNFLGIVLVPINVLLVYVLTPSKTFIYVIILLLLIINIVGFVLFLSSNLKEMKNNLFYFILYLCALEIAPYIILYKII